MTIKLGESPGPKPVSGRLRQSAKKVGQGHKIFRCLGLFERNRQFTCGHCGIGKFVVVMQTPSDSSKISRCDSKALLSDARYLTIHGMMQRISGLKFCGRHIGLFMTAYLLCSAAISEELLIAVASNFSGPMAELVKRFEAQTGHDIQVAYGSSGRLFAQIRSGAPFQIFLSADQDKPARLAELGLADSASRFTYASGELVLWSADSSREVGIRTPCCPRTCKDSACQPRLAPYGTAAADALDELGLSAHLSGKIVQGENIAQTFQFVESGNAQLGFVARSQVLSLPETRAGATWVVPDHLYRPIRQDAVLLNRAIGCEACSDF